MNDLTTQSNNLTALPEDNILSRSKVSEVFALILAVLFWFGVIFTVVWNAFPDSQTFLKHWWLLLAISLVIVSAILGWFKRTTTGTRTVVFVFFIIPSLLLGIGAILFLPNDTQKIIGLRSVFLFHVCLLPALIFYFFIATRKIGFLNDYFVNLGRLGLLKPRSMQAVTSAQDPKKEYQVRLLNYIQRFEGLYGPVPPRLREAILKETPLVGLADPTLREAALAGITEVFTPETAIPVVVATILIALGWLLALPPTAVPKEQSFWDAAFKINENEIIFAFLGAYFFSLQMLFRRYVREDLRRSAYIAVSLRIIVAVIGTWAAVTAIKVVGHVDSTSSTAYLPIVGFIIGFFPGVVWQFIQGATAKLGSIVLPSMQSRLPLSDLDGLTAWHESRLEEEDIENIPNMASADIVDLMISTRISPDRIVDWVDQAILFTHLGPKQDKVDGDFSRREQLRLQGIYTATSLIQAFEGAQLRPQNDAALVEKILSDASRSHIRSLIDVMKTEPNLELIRAWRGIAPAERETKAVMIAPPGPETKAVIAPAEPETKAAA